MTLLVERSEGLLVWWRCPAKVVRIEERGERTLYGVDFGALPPDEEHQLAMLLQMVSSGRGPGQRASTPGWPRASA